MPKAFKIIVPISRVLSKRLWQMIIPIRTVMNPYATLIIFRLVDSSGIWCEAFESIAHRYCRGRTRSGYTESTCNQWQASCCRTRLVLLSLRSSYQSSSFLLFTFTFAIYSISVNCLGFILKLAFFAELNDEYLNFFLNYLFVYHKFSWLPIGDVLIIFTSQSTWSFLLYCHLQTLQQTTNTIVMARAYPHYAQQPERISALNNDFNVKRCASAI